MPFDWKLFCDAHQIEYVTAGPNTAKGNINIHCPFCGASDPSHHMGLSLNKQRPSWGCWRDQRHRGSNPAYLVAILLKVSKEAATSYVEMQQNNPDDFESALAALTAPQQKEQQEHSHKAAHLPKEAAPLTRVGRGIHYWNYLKHRRKFKTDVAVAKAAVQHRLMYCDGGDYQTRIIIPIYEGRDLMSFTSRTLVDDASLRYRALPKEESVHQVKDCLLGYNRLIQRHHKLLFVCEGPLDAIKLNAFAPRGVVATCLFGLTVSDRQQYLLHTIAQRVDQVVVVLDVEAEMMGVIIADLLEEAGYKNPKVCVQLPDGVKDPGDFTPSQAEDFIREWL